MSKAAPGQLNKKPSLGERLRPGAAIRKKSAEFLTDLRKTVENFSVQAAPDDPVNITNHEVYKNNLGVYNGAREAEKSLSFMTKAKGGDAVAEIWAAPYNNLQKAKDERRIASEEALRQRNQASGVQNQHSRLKPTENRLGGPIIAPEDIGQDAFTSNNDGFRFAPMPTPTPTVTKRVEVDEGLKPRPGRRRVGKQPEVP
ncbi:hypothetical protein M422DRAFT_30900, partial [Sphaerobolus stellatus SS14]